MIGRNGFAIAWTISINANAQFIGPENVSTRHSGVLARVGWTRLAQAVRTGRSGRSRQGQDARESLFRGHHRLCTHDGRWRRARYLIRCAAKPDQFHHAMRCARGRSRTDIDAQAVRVARNMRSRARALIRLVSRVSVSVPQDGSGPRKACPTRCRRISPCAGHLATPWGWHTRGGETSNRFAPGEGVLGRTAQVLPDFGHSGLGMPHLSGYDMAHGKLSRGVQGHLSRAGYRLSARKAKALWPDIWASADAV